MKVECCPHRGASLGGLEEYPGEAGMGVNDRGRMGMMRGKRTRQLLRAPENQS